MLAICMGASDCVNAGVQIAPRYNPISQAPAISRRIGQSIPDDVREIEHGVSLQGAMNDMRGYNGVVCYGEITQHKRRSPSISNP